MLFQHYPEAVFVCLLVSAFSLQLYSRATFPMTIYSIAREWLGAYCSDSPASVVLCPLLLVWKEQGRRSRTSTGKDADVDGAEAQLWQRKVLPAGHTRCSPAHGPREPSFSHITEEAEGVWCCPSGHMGIRIVQTLQRTLPVPSECYHFVLAALSFCLFSAQASVPRQDPADGLGQVGEVARSPFLQRVAHLIPCHCCSPKACLLER